MTYDKRRLQISFYSSLGAHMVMAAFFTYWQITQKPPHEFMLEDIRIIEIEPDKPVPVQPQVSAQTPGKKVIQFLKRAFVRKETQDFKEFDFIESKKPVTKTAAAQRLDLSKKLSLPAQPKIDLNTTLRAPKRTDSLGEMTPDMAVTTRKTTAMSVPREPTIDLTKTTQKTQGPSEAAHSIDLSKKINLPKTNLKEMAVSDNALMPNRNEPAMKNAQINIHSNKQTQAPIPHNQSSPSVALDKKIPFDKYKTDTNQFKEMADVTYTTKKENHAKEARGNNQSVEITGPVTQRKVIKSILPAYPDWARADHIEAYVSIKFYVSPDGQVKDKRSIVITSGYRDMDHRALKAIGQWLFSTVDPKKGEQWGVITFRYKLK